MIMNMSQHPEVTQSCIDIISELGTGSVLLEISQGPLLIMLD